MGRGGANKGEKEPLSEIDSLRCDRLALQNELLAYKTAICSIARHLKDEDYLGDLDQDVQLGGLAYITNLVHHIVERKKQLEENMGC